MMDEAHVVDVAIIGAGWYGLVAARTYLRLRPEANILILDSDSTVGGVWSKERLYPNLVAQVKLGLFNYTDTPMSADGTTEHNLVTGEMIHKYLMKYAEDHDLLRHIRFNSFVDNVQRCSGGWQLQLRDSDEVFEAEKLLVATGVTSIPHMPSLDSNDASLHIIHSKDLGSKVNELKTDDIQHVVVIGAAKSAYDAVYLLLLMGKKVTWVIRPDGAGPLAILPTEIFGFFNTIAVASTRLMTSLSPSILNTNGIMYSFLQKTVLGRWCTSRFWDTITYLSNRHAGYDDNDHVAGLRPEVEGKSIFWANSGLGVVTLPNFWSTIHQGDVTIVRDNLSSVNEKSLHFRSGKVVPADYIVACTGWGDHFAMFDDTLKTELGLPVYGKADPGVQLDSSWEQHDIDADKSVNKKLPFLAVTPVLKNPQTNTVKQRRWRLYRRSIPLSLALKGDRSLAILGQIHTVQTPLVSEVQSFWSILYLLGEIDLPDEDVMTKEIAEWNAWTRKRYLSQGQKFPYSLYDFLPYVDTLCKDLGINSHRKSNPISELFRPYKPEDFNGFIDEFLAKREQKANGKLAG